MTNTIQEAKRYLENAKGMLSEKARKEDGFYQDTKYVKLAGHAAYAGVLLALDVFLGEKTKGRKDVDWYKKRLSGADKRLLATFVSVYNILHLSMSYDGIANAKVAQVGLEDAQYIIDWVENRMAVA